LAHLARKRLTFVSDKAREEITRWFQGAIGRAGLLHDSQFVAKEEFKESGFTGSGGISRFRNLLWTAAFNKKKLGRLKPETIAERASIARDEVNKVIFA
jgi:hypothetical protein